MHQRPSAANGFEKSVAAEIVNPGTLPARNSVEDSSGRPVGHHDVDVVREMVLGVETAESII